MVVDVLELVLDVVGATELAELGNRDDSNATVEGVGWTVGVVVVDDEFDRIFVDVSFWPDFGLGLVLAVCGVVVVFEFVSSEGVYKM